MTRPTDRSRVTSPRATGPAETPSDRRDPGASLRKRNPLAFWAAIVGAAAIGLSTFATALSAIL